MRKLILSLIAVAVGTLSSFAQSDLVATLSHGSSLFSCERQLAFLYDMRCTYMTKMLLNDYYLATINGSISSICYLGINRPLEFVIMPIENGHTSYTIVNDL